MPSIRHFQIHFPLKRFWKHSDKLVHTLRVIACVVLVTGSLRNIWTFDYSVINGLPFGASDEMVVNDARYKPIRQLLEEIGYPSGPITFITHRTLKAEPRIDEDVMRWGEAQYAMVPWILLQNQHVLSGLPQSDRGVPFVIGDFFDGGEPISEIPTNLSKIYDAGGGVILYRSRPAP